MSLPENIRRCREAASLTQRELGEACEVDGSAVAHWEAGRTSPRADQLPVIARAVGVTVGELFGEAAAG